MSAKTTERRPPSSPWREGFAKLLEDPSRDKLHELLRESGGEFRDLDFKVEWPAKAALAKQVLALGNIGGGVLVVGVRENADGSLTPEGVPSFTDKADITSWIKGIVPSGLLEAVAVHDFDYPTGEYGVIQGMKFQVMFVQPNLDHLPFLPLREGEKIVPGTIYVRRDGMVDAATHDEVQRILNERIERGHSTQPTLDIRAHLDQLKVLYENIKPTKTSNLEWLIPHMATSSWVKALGGSSTPNPHYPAQTFEEFVSSQIKKKQALVEQVLGTDGLSPRR
ncbi:MAG TPA: hypothetical protein VF699_07905 [Caulobacteraceae bacterium]|jgi:hypothetical protein